MCSNLVISLFCFLRILRQHGLNSNETVKARMEEWRSENIKSPQFLAFVVDMLIEQLEIGVEEASSKFEEIENVSLIDN